MQPAYRIHKTLAALRKGETVRIAEINRAFDPVVVEVVAETGFACVWLDMEHTHLDFDDLSTMVIAARAVDLDVVVRIPHGPYNQVVKTLEVGAGGLIWPHCKSAAEARELVKMAKFRPLGLRGIGAGRDSHYGKLPLKEYLDAANENTLLGVMIEDEEGVDDVEAIAAVEGIDLLFVGPADLAHSYGVEREPGSPVTQERVLEAYDKVAAACRANGKVMGTAVGPGEAMRNVVQKGARWLNCCHEVTALRVGYEQAFRATGEIVNSE